MVRLPVSVIILNFYFYGILLKPLYYFMIFRRLSHLTCSLISGWVLSQTENSADQRKAKSSL